MKPKRSRASNDHRNTAYHEAGHVVVSVALGFPIDKVTIKRHRDPLWGVFLGETARPGLRTLEGAAEPREFRRMVRDSIISTYAGFEAELICDPGANPKHAKHDWDEAWSAPSHYSVFPRGCRQVGDEVYEAFLLRQRQTARLLARKHWRAIEAVAEALLRRGTLSGEEVQAIALPFLGSSKRIPAVQG